MSTIYIYVIGREQGPVKVGITNTLGGRLAVLRTACPFEIQLLHWRETRNRKHALMHEKLFHEVYAGNRLAGEWFDLEADLAIEGIETSFDHEKYFESQGQTA